MADVLIEMNLDGFDNDFTEMETALVKLQKTLYWLLGQLDSLNVKRLSTNMTDIKSDDGNTRITGTQVKMSDSKGNERLTQGLNPETGQFEFRMKNNIGSTTVYLDENGNAVFTGHVLASAISGGTINGVEINGATITGGEISADTTINVGTNATIGKTLTLKDGESEGGTISIFEESAPVLLIKGVGARPIKLSTLGRIDLEAREVYINGKEVLTRE